jgi:hypothetical protein
MNASFKKRNADKQHTIRERSAVRSDPDNFTQSGLGSTRDFEMFGCPVVRTGL